MVEITRRQLLTAAVAVPVVAVTLNVTGPLLEPPVGIYEIVDFRTTQNSDGGSVTTKTYRYIYRNRLGRVYELYPYGNSVQDWMIV